MKARTDQQLLSSIRTLIIVFIVFLVLSGITAFPIETELDFLSAHASSFPQVLTDWIGKIRLAVKATNAQYPQLAYGTDWLAFAHLVIAVAFIGPLQDPVRNIWVIRFGMIACCMIFPLALIAGPIRQIPLYWQLIDCSFGVIGLLPLYVCYRRIRQLETLQNKYRH